MKRLQRLVASLGIGLAAVSISLAVWQVLTSTDGTLSDATRDWLVVAAAVDGLSPSADLSLIAKHYDVALVIAAEEEIEGDERIHPRPPGSLLLLLPMTLIEATDAHAVAVAANAVAFIVLIAMLLQTSGELAGLHHLALAGLLPVTWSIFTTLEFGASSGLIALLLLLSWRLKQRRLTLAGVAVGTATAWKLFPGLIVLAIARYSRRLALFSLVFGAVLTFGGVILLRLPPDEWISSLTGASNIWIAYDSNASLAGLLARSLGFMSVASNLLIAGVCIAAALLASTRYSVDDTFAIALILSVVAAPLSWPHYDALLIPVAFHLLDRSDWPSRFSVWVWVGLGMLGAIGVFSQVHPPFAEGGVALVGRLVLLAGVLWRHGSRHTLSKQSVDYIEA